MSQSFIKQELCKSETSEPGFDEGSCEDTTVSGDEGLLCVT